MNFVEELKWRGMLHDAMPGTEEQLQKEMTLAYVGIDPTADSLHIGHLVGVMMLKHLQLCGHKPIALLGGATGMIGDPSGKSQERNLLDLETLRKNQDGIKKQLAKFLNFEDNVPNAAMLVNNYDWMSKYSFLDFIRDIGKHLTVNYMMAKDSVKKRFSGEGDGMSFTEFTYQLVQGYDYLFLYQTYGCKLQMGGSDQWGNITTGTELIRRKTGGEAFAIVCPLITKADGGKFGKTEQGNIWLDPEKTSPYQFYQFWLNCSDDDSKRYIRIFTLLSETEIKEIEAAHNEAPHLRLLQKKLAQDLTCRVHSEAEYDAAVAASEILFGKGTAESLAALPEKTFLSVFEGVPQVEIDKSIIKEGINIVDFLTDVTQIFPSKGEARRTLKENGISINKEKITDAFTVDLGAVLNGKYILVQRGKKSYYIVGVR
ncbi:MAG: tyrosine--tRNA ligase [Bacteroidetes bacterium]|nr:tyrosine--tRNA ligase [Bacteroidota bacterium]MCL2301642.1 tyrosine--tRNA ligase [Lentimicrobiaceae bacterium]